VRGIFVGGLYFNFIHLALAFAFCIPVAKVGKVLPIGDYEVTPPARRAHRQGAYIYQEPAAMGGGPRAGGARTPGP
jgi:hypothetical protein